MAERQSRKGIQEVRQRQVGRETGRERGSKAERQVGGEIDPQARDMRAANSGRD
jgi:hypothetical protein